MSDITTQDDQDLPELDHSHDEIIAQIKEIHPHTDDDDIVEVDEEESNPTSLMDQAAEVDAAEAAERQAAAEQAAHEQKLASIPNPLSIFTPNQFNFERIFTTDALIVDAVISETTTPEDKALQGHIYGIINPDRDFVARNGTTFGGAIQFQMGPVPEAGVNGFTNEAVLTILIHRTQVLDNQFPCDENKAALRHMQAALDAFNARTANREARGVEGTLQA